MIAFVVFILVICLVVMGLSIAIFVKSAPREELHLSFKCNDYDPCTLDVIDYVHIDDDDRHDFWRRDDDDEHHHHHHHCPPLAACRHLPVANGTCCNEEDYCYLSDEHKRCVDGRCVSPNLTLCKGYCTDVLNCSANAIPLIVSPLDVFPQCFFGSCVTTVIVAQTPVDPYALINVTSNDVRRLEGCLDAVCVFNPNSFDYKCIYVWRCAPFNGAIIIDAVRSQNVSTEAILFPGRPLTPDYIAMGRLLNTYTSNIVSKARGGATRTV